MPLVFELGVSSSDAITIEPKQGSYLIEDEQIRADTRTRGGKKYEYKWGEFTRIGFEVEFITNSDRDTINDWFDNRTELLFFITSGGTTEVHSVMIMNNKSPISKLVKPYTDQWMGNINLETY